MIIIALINLILFPYSDLTYLRKHIRKFHEEGNQGGGGHKCKKCPEMFATKKDLSLHKIEKHRSCEQCGKSFEGAYWASALDIHIRAVHLGQKKNICDTCGKAFFAVTDMKRHIGKKNTF